MLRAKFCFPTLEFIYLVIISFLKAPLICDDMLSAIGVVPFDFFVIIAW